MGCSASDDYTPEPSPRKNRHYLRRGISYKPGLYPEPRDDEIVGYTPSDDTTFVPISPTSTKGIPSARRRDVVVSPIKPGVSFMLSNCENLSHGCTLTQSPIASELGDDIRVHWGSPKVAGNPKNG